MHKTLLLCAALSLTLCACVTRPIVSVPPASCAKLIPEEWSQPVSGTPVPIARKPRVVPPGSSPLVTLQAAYDDAMDAVRDWAGAYVSESGQRTKANERGAATIGIYGRCEAMVNAARPG